MNRRVVLVCGGCNYDDRRKAYQTLDAVHAEEPISRIVTGQAPGADQLAIDWAGARQVEHVEVTRTQKHRRN